MGAAVSLLSRTHPWVTLADPLHLHYGSISHVFAVHLAVHEVHRKMVGVNLRQDIRRRELLAVALFAGDRDLPFVVAVLGPHGLREATVEEERPSPRLLDVRVPADR